MTDVAVSEADLRRTDVFAWLRAQADALRAREAGRNAIAYDELAEEVDGLAQSVRNKVYSLTGRIVEHLFKLEFVDSPRDRAHWRKEILAFRGQLARVVTPTLRNELIGDLAEVTRRELRGLIVGELIVDVDVVARTRPSGYSWAEITDDDWWPELIP
jgi:hypothetical protein